MDQTFEQNLADMTASIQGNKTLGRKMKAMLTPNAEAERSTHEGAKAAGTSCSCRVCYWAKGR